VSNAAAAVGSSIIAHLAAKRLGFYPGSRVAIERSTPPTERSASARPVTTLRHETGPFSERSCNTTTKNPPQFFQRNASVPR
ncbi:hypothetical protein DFH06DRAFT_1482765, partial [Mycena polygramma]